MKKQPSRKRLPLRALLLIALASLFGCREAGLYDRLGPLDADPLELRLGPAAVTLQPTDTTLFAALGGTPPYNYQVSSGTGNIDASTGIYEAPAVVANETVRVTDADGRTATASVRVVSADGALSVFPLYLTVPPGGTADFLITGGADPSANPTNYQVDIVVNETMAPAPAQPVPPSTVFTYTAGGSEGTDTVRIEDSVTGENRYVRVSVAVGTTNVDYEIANVNSAALSAGGTAGQPFTLTNAFEILNAGSNTGSENVLWRAYYSSDTTLGAGDTILDQGDIAGGLAPGGAVPISIVGTWPGDPGPGNIFLAISAKDDAGLANNQEGPISTTLAVPDVNYGVSGFTGPTGSTAGGPVSGSFDLNNTGGDAGGRNVFWAVYASTDNVLSVDDARIDSGQASPLGGGMSVSVPFAGLWPASPGSYFLIAEVAAADDVDSTPASNTGATATTTNVIAAVAPDFEATSITLDPGRIAEESASGTLAVRNNGPGDATSAVSYVIYASTDGVLDASDYVIGSGSQYPFLDSASLALPFAGSWPSIPGTYTIIGEVIYQGDSDTSNDVLVDANVVIAPAEADYVVASLTPGAAGTDVGTVVSGSFTYRNDGPYDGSGTLSFQVWASTDTVLSTSTDYLLDLGTGLSPLALGQTSGGVAFSGTWPLTSGAYYLIVVISSANDPTLANNTLASAVPMDVGIYYEEPSEPNGNYEAFEGDPDSNRFDTGATLAPGMRILVRGEATAADIDPNIFPATTNDDIIAVHSGTATVMTVTWVLDSGLNEDIAIFVRDGEGVHYPTLTGVSDTAASISYTVNLLGPALYWIDLENTAQADLGTYSLYITAY